MQRMGSFACGSGQGSGKQHLDLPHDVLRLSDEISRAGSCCSLAWGLVELRSPSPG